LKVHSGGSSISLGHKELDHVKYLDDEYWTDQTGPWKRNLLDTQKNVFNKNVLRRGCFFRSQPDFPACFGRM
jgi:hypothetical protein